MIILFKVMQNETTFKEININKNLIQKVGDLKDEYDSNSEFYMCNGCKSYFTVLAGEGLFIYRTLMTHDQLIDYINAAHEWTRSQLFSEWAHYETQWQIDSRRRS